MVPDWVADIVAADEWEPVGGGYTRAPKWRARLGDGTRVFVKLTEPRESIVYERVRGSFMPVVYDSHARDEGVVLVLEDLSTAHWPPPFPDDVDPLFAALDELAAVPAPPVRRLEEPQIHNWDRFQRDPAPLLALDVCSNEWLAEALPVLADAEASVPLAGEQLVHNDIWWDNLCFAERGVVFVDWAEARIANADIDLAFTLLSLHLGGAPPPAIEKAPALAAFVTGVVALEASSPLPPWTPEDSTLRQDQLADLRVALPWTAALLGLAPPA